MTIDTQPRDVTPRPTRHIADVVGSIDLSVTDAVAVVGFAVLVIGVALIFVPAAFVVAGALLLLYAVAASRTEAPKP